MDTYLASNSFNFIRLVAAVQVMVGHFIMHLHLPVNRIFSLGIYFFSGVPIFLGISGYLIWFSMERSVSYTQYLRKRVRRIYPELWVAVCLEILPMLFLYDSWEIEWLIPFILCQATVFQFWTPECLRGYGIGTPNGALWTIGIMVQFYIVAWGFYKYMKGRKVGFWIAGFAAAVSLSAGGSYLVHWVFHNEIIDKLYGQTILHYFWLFYAGMFIAAFQSYMLPICKRYWWLILAVALGIYIFKIDFYCGYGVFWSMFLVAGVIGFAYRFPEIKIPIDISYGLFLYHVIILNVFVTFGWLGEWRYALTAGIITAVIAYVSTVAIGKDLLARR